MTEQNKTTVKEYLKQSPNTKEELKIADYISKAVYNLWCQYKFTFTKDVPVPSVNNVKTNMGGFTVSFIVGDEALKEVGTTYRQIFESCIKNRVDFTKPSTVPQEKQAPLYIDEQIINNLDRMDKFSGGLEISKEFSYIDNPTQKSEPYMEVQLNFIDPEEVDKELFEDEGK